MTFEEKLTIAVDALKTISGNRYGLQGLMEEGASNYMIMKYWKSEHDAFRYYATEALKQINSISE